MILQHWNLLNSFNHFTLVCNFFTFISRDWHWNWCVLFFYIFNLYFICCLPSIREYYYKKIVHYMKWSREGRKNYNQLYSSIKTNERTIQFKMNLLGELNWNKKIFCISLYVLYVCLWEWTRKKKLNKNRL